MTCLRVASVFLAAVFASGAAAQDAYPSRPVKVVVPFPAGGATDILTRAVTERLAARLGQPLVIENKPGAGANIGAETVAKAAPDGYTLLIGSLASHSISATYYRNLGYDIRRDFAPISHVALITNIVVVGADVPAKNLAELVTLAKSQPGKLTCASSGTGGLIHLTCEMFKHAAGINVLHVPYKGTSFFLPDIMSGQITMSLDNLPPYLAQLKAGKVKALAVTTAKRSPVLPELPTVAESGYPGFESVASYAMLAPTGTPPSIVSRLNRELNLVLQEAAVKDKLLPQGIEPLGSSAEAVQATILRDVAKWAQVLKDGNIKAE